MATNKYRLQVRSAAGANTVGTASTPNSVIPSQLRITRSGNNFTAFFSTNGTTFTQFGATTNISMPPVLRVGLAVTSHTVGTLATAVFDNVTVVRSIGTPGGLTATAGNGQVNLAWNAVSAATDYLVKRATVSGGPYTTVTTVPTPGFLDTGLSNFTTFFYVVSARIGAAEGSNSAQVQATSQPPPPPLPPAPTGFTATLASGGNVRLSWNAVPVATEYSIRRSTNNEGPYTVLVTTTSQTTFLEPFLNNRFETLYYVVSVHNGAVEGRNSTQAPVTPFPAGSVMADWGLLGTTNNSSTPLPATSFRPELSSVTLTKSAALTAQTWTNAYGATGFPTGALDLSKFFEVSLTPASGRSLVFGTILFGIGNNEPVSGSWEMRSSVDGFATVLAQGSYSSTITTNIQVNANPLGVRTGTVTFRIYPFNNSGGSLPLQRTLPQSISIGASVV